MKAKFLLPIICSIVLGFLLGKIFFNEYDKEVITAMFEGEKIYFVQLGVYKDLETLEAVEGYKNFLVEPENDGYHLYAGITKSNTTAERLKGYYENLGNTIYIKERIITNKTFLNILTEYDKIKIIASSDNDLVSIEKIVLSNYEELVLQR